MNYYKQLFCNSKFFCLCLISLVVSFFIFQLDVNAQQVYDVNITNNSVEVKPWGLNSGYDLFNNAYDPGELDENGMEFSDDSPMTNGSGARAQSDYQEVWGSTMPSISNDVMTPQLSGRNPLGLTGYRYFQFGVSDWRTRQTFSKSVTASPLQQNWGTSTENYNVSLNDKSVIPNYANKNSLFNFTNFKNDILTALIGTQNFDFITRLIQILNTTPSSTNFTYTVPAIFGFNAGIVINIPFNDILHGTGDWYQFSNIISYFRSLLSILYYLAVVWVIIRCIFIYQ